MDHWISFLVAIHIFILDVPVITPRIPTAFRYNRQERRNRRSEKINPSRDHNVCTRDLVFMARFYPLVGRITHAAHKPHRRLGPTNFGTEVVIAPTIYW